jgi:hypothetical protein
VSGFELKASNGFRVPLHFLPIVPLITPVRIPLVLWHAKRGNPASGWVFPNGDGQPINLTKFVERVIEPRWEEAKSNLINGSGRVHR